MTGPMKLKAFLVVLFLILLAAGVIVYIYVWPDPIWPTSLHSFTAEQAGLIWHECELPVLHQSTNMPVQDESLACFGHSAPALAGDEKVSSGQYISPSDVRLTMGQDTYTVHADDWTALTVYTLYKNGERLKSLIGWGDTLWLHMFLFNVNAHVAWGIANEHINTIIYNSQDLRHVYGLKAARAGYSLAGKLIFVGEKDGRYFIVYDGHKIGPDYDRITIAYCCETALYSVRYGQDKYQFRGTRSGKDYIVEISVSPSLISEQTLAAFRFDSPIRDQTQAVIAAQVLLNSTRLVPNGTPQVLSVQALKLAEAQRRVAQPGLFATENRPGDTPVWLVIIKGAWQVFPPDPLHTITPAPASEGCVYVLMQANDPGYSQTGGIECTQ